MSAILEAQASLLLDALEDRGGSLQLTSDALRELNIAHGLSRTDCQRAADLLARKGRIRVTASRFVVLKLKAAGS
jgi:hypothetical protein